MKLLPEIVNKCNGLSSGNQPKKEPAKEFGFLLQVGIKIVALL
jgi:hypothetical protein